ncbi:MAG: tetratricopeptide (TPR) repeat protein [Verrucomicrobiales bacterium]|jgi:tetratricopeptide (TPR) repeat protein
MRNRKILILTIAFALIALTAILVIRGRGANPAHILARADAYFANEEFDSARIEYSNLIKEEPKNAHAYQQIGYGFLEQGLPLRALPYIAKSLELVPENLEAKGKLASAIFSLGDLNGARKLALEILDQASADEDAILLLANTSQREREGDNDEIETRLAQFDDQKQAVCHLVAAIVASRKGGDLEGTRASLDRALALEPESVPVNLARATYFQITKDKEKLRESLAKAAMASPIRSSARVRYAGFLARSGEVKKAKQLLEELTDQAQDFVPAWVLLAELSAGEKLFEEALGYLEKVFTRDSLNYAANMTKAQILLAQNEIVGATELLEQLDGAYKSGTPLHRFRIKLSLARLYARAGQLARAGPLLNEALEIIPGSPDAILALAEINLRTGYARDASDSLETLLKAAPGLVHAELLLARAYQAQERFDAAAAIFRNQIERDPTQAGSHFMLGLNLRAQKRPDEARMELEAAQKLAPNDQAIMFQLIALDIEKEDYSTAHSRVQALLDGEKGEEDWGAHFLQGQVYFAEKKWDEAEKVLLRALELKPDSLSVYNALIDSYIAAKNQPRAIRQLRELLKSKPKSVRHRVLLALLLESEKDYKSAAEEYALLLVDSPDFIPALNNLAYLKSEVFDDTEEAFRLANKAHTLMPEDSGISDTLGWILYKKRDYAEALNLLDGAADQAPDQAEIQYHLGMVHAKMGHGGLARIALEKAVAAEADFRGKEDAANELSKLGGGVGDKTIAELEAQLTKDPEDLIARIQLGRLFEQAGNYDTAAAAFNTALTSNPDLVDALVALARLNVGPLKSPSEASKFVTRALALSPGNSELEGIKGLIALQEGDFGYAYGLLQTALANPKSSKNSSFQSAMGHAAYGHGRIDEARGWMSKVTDAASTAPADAKAAAGSFLALTEPKPADQEALRALARKQLSNDSDDLPASMLLASMQASTDQAAAAAAYQAILVRVGNFVPAQRELAVIYARDPNRHKEALALTQKVDNALPDDPTNTQTRGILSYHMDEKDASFAIQLLKSVDDLKALDAEGLFYLGMAYIKEDQGKAGVEALQRALQADLPEALSLKANAAIEEANKPE